ncbi:MAG: hypothetical protein LBO20_04330 [Bifidobacteriaceae bacterium]|nr:hypothetical protein [Bifidobacteriaceae bacterium]
MCFSTAEAIQPHIKTLDAIHLGSLIAAGLDAVVVSHDTGMISAATSLGYQSFEPVEKA